MGGEGMKRYKGSIFWSNEDDKKLVNVGKKGEWYKADDMADLASQCRPYLHHINCHCDSWNDEHTKCGCGLFQLKAELEQIAGK